MTFYDWLTQRLDAAERPGLIDHLMEQIRHKIPQLRQVNPQTQLNIVPYDGIAFDYYELPNTSEVTELVPKPGVKAALWRIWKAVFGPGVPNHGYTYRTHTGGNIPYLADDALPVAPITATYSKRLDFEQYVVSNPYSQIWIAFVACYVPEQDTVVIRCYRNGDDHRQMADDWLHSLERKRLAPRSGGVF